MTLHELFRRCAPFFIYSALFSLATNLLALSPSLYLLTVFDRVLSTRSNETLWVLSAVFLFALAIEAIIDRQRSRLLTKLGDTVFAKLKARVFRAVLRFKNRSPEQEQGLEDLSILQSFLGGHGLKAAFEVPWIPIYLLVLWLFHPLLSIIAMISTLIMFALTYLEEMVTHRNEASSSVHRRMAIQFVEEAQLNAEVAQAMNLLPVLERRWEAVHARYALETEAALEKVTAISGLSKFMRNALQLVEMGAAAWLVINIDGVSPGVTIAATIILGKAMSPILTVLMSWRTFIQFRTSFKRLDQLLNEEAGHETGLLHAPPEGHLAVESVLFYLRRDRTILNGPTFTLPAGESLGVVGASAAGKTSLARLLVGLYAPSDGAVRLDGLDVHAWSRKGLGAHIGYLAQNQQLFDGTVAENIARMNDIHENPEAVVLAARKAGAHQMITRLPQGYDTRVGPAGSALSGGQRQLIALARALYGDPKLVVLDEPSANLDVATERGLLETFRILKTEGVTLVVISHSPLVIRETDNLLVLEEGRQVAFGAHQDVLKFLQEGRRDALRHELALME